ncbi:MAG: hypothetical protein WCH99_03850 [Verrucomicrobiota bacterium]
MKRPLIILTALVFTCGCAHMGAVRDKGTFAVYGADALSTTAPNEVLGRAAWETHDVLAHWSKDSNGKNYDPSYGGGGQSWSVGKAGNPGPAKEVVLSRSKSEFKDADGHRFTIEAIRMKGAQTIVFFSHEGSSPEIALNAYIASLQKQGVKKRDAN